MVGLSLIGLWGPNNAHLSDKLALNVGETMTTLTDKDRKVKSLERTLPSLWNHLAFETL